MAGWNAGLVAAGLALLAGAGELWLRSTVPFTTRSVPRAFVPGVGIVGKAGAEVRWTNRLDVWQISRFNSEGFLDREPPRTEPAADACHVTVIGDSFVEAKEVPITAKLHVRLEVLAAREPGSLNVTTSAFGQSGTGQISQLAYYDEFARKRAPALIVLVFVENDYTDNSPLLSGSNPEWHMTAERAADGALRLRPPNLEFEDDELLRRHRRRDLRSGCRRDLRFGCPPEFMRLARVTRRAAQRSYFGRWLHAMWQIAWADMLRKEHSDAPLLDAFARRGWLGEARFLHELFAAERLPPPYAAELEYTAFALEQFRQRADRDGAALVILAEHHLRPGEPSFDRMRAIADGLRIPVVSLHDHVVRRGGRVRDAHWRHDVHWTPAGHQWAAEALLEHLRRRPDICARGPRRTPAPVAAGAADAGTTTTMFDGDPLHAARELELPVPERPEHTADG